MFTTIVMTVIGGTAPLTRGRPHHRRHRRRSRRNSPAHAGTTEFLTALLRRAAEQPRSRGDDTALGDWKIQHRGTAPLTRGRQIENVCYALWSRNSPAHAGTTRTQDGADVADEEQPRSRGDDPGGHARPPLGDGTAPLTRGRLTGPPVNGFARRNSPAHAGTTRSCGYS